VLVRCIPSQSLVLFKILHRMLNIKKNNTEMSVSTEVMSNWAQLHRHAAAAPAHLLYLPPIPLLLLPCLAPLPLNCCLLSSLLLQSFHHLDCHLQQYSHLTESVFWHPTLSCSTVIAFSATRWQWGIPGSNWTTAGESKLHCEARWTQNDSK